MLEIPRIISVDDHVVEPPDLWQSRLPRRDRDRGPRIERKRLRFGGDGRGGGGSTLGWTEDPDGDWCDVWYYDDLVSPFMMLSAAVGFEEVGFATTTFDDIRRGARHSTHHLGGRPRGRTARPVAVSAARPLSCPRPQDRAEEDPLRG